MPDVVDGITKLLKQTFLELLQQRKAEKNSCGTSWQEFLDTVIACHGHVELEDVKMQAQEVLSGLQHSEAIAKLEQACQVVQDADDTQQLPEGSVEAVLKAFDNLQGKEDMEEHIYTALGEVVLKVANSFLLAAADRLGEAKEEQEEEEEAPSTDLAVMIEQLHGLRALVEAGRGCGCFSASFEGHPQPRHKTVAAFASNAQSPSVKVTPSMM